MEVALDAAKKDHEAAKTALAQAKDKVKPDMLRPASGCAGRGYGKRSKKAAADLQTANQLIISPSKSMTIGRRA